MRKSEMFTELMVKLEILESAIFKLHEEIQALKPKSEYRNPIHSAKDLEQYPNYSRALEKVFDYDAQLNNTPGVVQGYENYHE